ncbi:MAG: hypothetical protein DSZ12_01680, partial [Sulfurovum sp.]
MLNYWYFGDNLNGIPTQDELNEYYNDVRRLANFLSDLKGDISIIFEPEFNKPSIVDNPNAANQFAQIISNAIDIVKRINPHIKISLSMMDTGIRDSNSESTECGFDNCSIGDLHEWSKTDTIFKYLEQKLDFISFNETLSQFSRDPSNPGTMDDPNP